MKPIYLLSDSALLFLKEVDGASVLEAAIESTGSKRPSLAYIGASNSDDLSVYHEIFLPALHGIDAGEARMILAQPTAQDGAFLATADIIVLAGGSVESGWRAFERNGFKTLIERRHSEGVTLLGVSAGAVQLGLAGLTDDGSTLLPTFGFAPFYVAAHEERDDWASLRRMVPLHEGPAQGIGIPAGGGLIYKDREVFPLRKPLFELRVDASGGRESLILPAP